MYVMKLVRELNVLLKQENEHQRTHEKSHGFSASYNIRMRKCIDMKRVEIYDPAMCCSTGVSGPSTSEIHVKIMFNWDDTNTLANSKVKERWINQLYLM